MMRRFGKYGLYGVVVCGMLWFVVGGVRFMDGVHPCGVDQYCGKFGWPHSKQEYEAFRFWQTTLFALWPFVIVSMGVLGWMQRAETKKAGTAGHDPAATPPNA
jgi:hypothetical protein